MLAVVALVLLSCALSVSTVARTPLLIPGKTTLYERVLTRPGAKIAPAPGAAGTREMPVFTPLYVYGRAPADGGGRSSLEVGTDATGKILGFIDERETIPWRHALVLAFTPRVNRDRVLFFKDQQSLTELLNAGDVRSRVERLRQPAAAGTLDPASPVISIEPEVPVDFEKNFYMLPVLEAQNQRLPTGFQVRTVKIASVTKDPAQASVEQLNRRVNPDALDQFRAGVVFVIDASNSMQPYINRTRQVMGDVLKRVEAAGLVDRVRFGLIAYRDDPKKVAGMGYLTKTFADPNVVKTAADFAAATTELNASKISTQAFSEDGFAAVERAIDSIDWATFGARSIVMITDASSREGSSPYSSTGLNTPELHQLAARNDIAVYVLHLKTPAGKDDHVKAEAQYKALSQYADAGSLYFPVESGDPETFKATVEQLAEALVRQVSEARRVVTAKSEELAKAAKPGGPAAIKARAALVGRAMALAYLGRQAGVEAPSMFEAWASDRDFTHPEVAPFSVRVLLTKNQLSDLQRTLQGTMDALEAAQVDPGDLFNQLRSAAVAIGRDPSQVGQGKAKDLEVSGLMGEYLEGLPFQSSLMSLSQDWWENAQVADQQKIIDDVASKIRLYQRYHDDASHWVKLNEGDDPGDWVYPVPLESLP